MWSLIINNILLKILLPPPRGEQGATGIILANGRGIFSEKGHLKIFGRGKNIIVKRAIDLQKRDVPIQGHRI